MPIRFGTRGSAGFHPRIWTPQRISSNASVSRLFGIDYRALKAFRAGLAVLVLGDLCTRSVDMEAFYTDAGVLPRSLLKIPEFRFSFHAMAGGRGGEWALFLLAAAFALLLLSGTWSRLAAFASWLLLASLDARNPLVLNHGDELLRIFLFWSVFVPLSSDGPAKSDGSGRRHLSLFTAALVLQVCFVYFFGALLKSDPSWSSAGTAIYNALSLEQLSTGMGRALLARPGLLKIATLLVYYLELVGPVLLFVPWGNRRIREVLIVLFVAMHLAIAATMNLGLFPWVSILGWVVLLPSETVDSIQRMLRIGPAGPMQAAAGAGSGNAPLAWAARILGAYLLASVLVWNIRGLGTKPEEQKPLFHDRLLLMAQLDQRWNMFAPKPNYVSGWYAAEAELPDGSKVDPMRGGQPFSPDRPDVVASTYPDARWRKFLVNLSLPRGESCRQAFASYLERRWDGEHPASRRMARLTVYFMWQDLSSPRGNTPVRTTVIAGF
jgi:hypothetical protein